MSTRTRQSQRIQEDLYDDFEENLDLDMLSDEELEEILFEEDAARRARSRRRRFARSLRPASSTTRLPKRTTRRSTS